MFNPKIILIIFPLLSFFQCATSYEKTSQSDWEIHSFRREYQNVHLLKQKNNKYIMIDSGGYESAPLLEKDILSKGINPKDIEIIIISHGHWDHVAGSKYFQDKYNIPVALGKGDERLLKQRKSDKLCPTNMMASSRQKEDESHTFESPKVDKWIEAETKLESMTSTQGRIIPLPGHTDGSLVVVVGKNAFVGDLFRGSLLGDKPEVHFYICDLGSNREDILKLLESIAPQAEFFYPGHFGPSIKKKDILDKFL